MTAPTEEEIRSALADKMVERVGDHSGDVVYDASEPLRKMWNHDEFRASETACWEELIEVVYVRAAAQFAEILLDDLTRIGVGFARLYPDAPRAKPELVTA